MFRLVRAGCVLAVGCAGCAAVPPIDNPVLVRPADAENPIVVSPEFPTPAGYMAAYDRVLDAVDDYFDLKPGSRFPGQVETLPRVAAGYEQPWKSGSPDARERLLATYQTIRHWAVVKIQSAERGGFKVYVEVYKELEDAPQPYQAIAGAATFREPPADNRRIEAVRANTPSEWPWIPCGRDYAFEQVILRKIQAKCSK